MGISGMDGSLIRAKMRNPDLGYVGSITEVNIAPVMDLLEKGYIPVVSTLGCDADGNTYNINGDTAAAYIAGALGAERLIMMTDIAGVLRDKNDPSTLISELSIGEAVKLFDTHVAGALSFVLERCSEPGKILSAAGLEDNTIVRDSYNGALCASQVKRRIVVSFFSFSRSHELRFLIADIIKYSENKIRAAIGVKSRLSVFTLPDPVRVALDEYFALNLKKNSSVSSREKPREEYEKLYDAPKTELSPENAAKIEDSSWQVTKILVEAFEEEEKKEEPIIEEKPAEKEICENADSPLEELKRLLGEKYNFVVAALESDGKKQSEIADKLSIMADALADEINDLAAEIIGDIILEDQGGYYTVIEDYREIFENE
jgi:hypothetical protein